MIPAAVIISGLEHSAAATEIMRRLDCPVIEVMDTDGEPIDTSVGFSMQSAGRIMADYLAERSYRRIGYVGAWGERPARSRKRREAFVAGAKGCATLLHRHPDIDVVFFANDDLALGAMFHCLSTGVDIPCKLALAGFNGLEMRDGISPLLTTIRSPRAAQRERHDHRLRPGGRVGFQHAVRNKLGIVQHPRRAKALGEHGEALGPKGFARRHGHITRALGQRSEHALELVCRDCAPVIDRRLSAARLTAHPRDQSTDGRRATSADLGWRVPNTRPPIRRG